ncbi:MAG: hypothetical protein ACLPWS_14060 [Rhodomicrobium sp.]
MARIVDAIGRERGGALSCVEAAALEAGCERLYTEDLQHGQAIGPLRVENPFVT